MSQKRILLTAKLPIISPIGQRQPIINLLLLGSITTFSMTISPIIIAKPTPNLTKAEPADAQTPQTTPDTPIPTKTVPTLKALKFANYPASVYRGKRAKPNLANLAKLGSFYLEEINQPNNVGEKKFAQNLVKTTPNYAGHYVISSFNCGANCTASVAYDVKTGNFLELGGGFANCPATSYSNAKNVDVIHRADSKLLIVIGATNLGNCVAGYFVESKGNITLISQKPLLIYGNANTGF